MNWNKTKLSVMAALAGMSFLVGCMKQVGVAPNGVASTQNQQGQTTPTPSSSPISDPSNPVGVAVVKNFNSYYQAMVLCTQTQPDAPTVAYFQQASLVLPQNTYAASVNDAVIQGATKLASYIANMFIFTDLNKAAASRLALGMVPVTAAASTTAAGGKGTSSTPNSTTPPALTLGSLTGFSASSMVSDVVTHFVPMCLGRSATPSDISDATTAFNTAVGNGTPTAKSLQQGLLVVLTGLLAAEMPWSN